MLSAYYILLQSNCEWNLLGTALFQGNKVHSTLFKFE